MVHGRRETTPSQQLAELRKARDRYAALAEQDSDQDACPDISEDPEERKRDALRIVFAYDKSIATMAANLDRIQEAELLASKNNRSRLKLAAAAGAIVLIAATGYFAFAGPGMQFLRTVFAPSAERPVKRAVTAAPPNKANEPDVNHPTSLIPIPTARPEIANTKPADIQRPPVQAPRPETLKHVTTTVRTNSPSNGFVAKVLQPDGSFKDEYFSASPSR